MPARRAAINLEVARISAKSVSAPALDAELAKPVTSSNHALAWHCLRLAGYHEPVPGFGRLFRV